MKREDAIDFALSLDPATPGAGRLCQELLADVEDRSVTRPAPEPVLFITKTKRVHNTTLRRFGSSDPTGHGIVLPAFHAAARGGRSIFPTRIFAPDELPRLLKSGHHSRKIGAYVTKGRRKGWPIYTLTLEERASCPRACKEWLHCYGNNMQAAERIEHGPALEAGLTDELAELQRQHPEGFMVRLHVLGDFYSEEYVAMWAAAIDCFPALHVFGFTARLPGTPIGDALRNIIENNWSRFAMRFSGLDEIFCGAVTTEPGEDTPHVVCPAQTGATETCGTCALCWHSDRTIAFRRH